METKVKELNAVHLELRGHIAVLEERVAREESEKLVRLTLEKLMKPVFFLFLLSFQV